MGMRVRGKATARPGQVGGPTFECWSEVGTVGRLSSRRFNEECTARANPDSPGKKFPRADGRCGWLRKNGLIRR